MSPAISPQHRPRWKEVDVIRRARWFIVLVCLLVVLANAWSLVEGRTRQIRQAELANLNLARALALQMDAVFGEAGRLIENIAFDLEQRELSDASPQSMQPALVHAVAQMAYLDNLVIIDAAGRWRLYTQPTSPTDTDKTTQPYFEHHRSSPSASAFVGAPIVDRASRRWIIPVSKRLNDPFGRFAGVVLATVDLAQIGRVLATYEIGARGAIGLIHDNGTVLARRPDDGQQMGRGLASSQLHQMFAGRTRMSAEATSPIDGEVRIFGFQHLPQQPLYVLVGASKREVLRVWVRGAAVQSAAVLTMCLVIGLAGASVVRAVRQRVMAEAEAREAGLALEASNLQLSHLVRHDALTGLANRRYLDSMLEEAVARGSASRNPLALLMIDVDHFKAVNDTLGHQAGDECLRRVAAAVREMSEREGGFAARYGGEEMAVLLLDHERPVEAAEFLREAIERLEWPVTGPLAQKVTVSVGVALADAKTLETPGELIAAADRALYAAKAGGRNRVAVNPGAADSGQVGMPT
ncbi:MAG: sensor domain-containing diguanylate cyclase [Variovorax paradoxus]|uniref:diguanylate cyclase n=1 Tax=Variovorax paradoxus TaxID=34073 RepID=A0A2W5QC60_VARPD|nr:MAG: sensor domain-containing diguanylate cyclase [Variovorax paradoxus]